MTTCQSMLVNKCEDVGDWLCDNKYVCLSDVSEFRSQNCLLKGNYTNGSCTTTQTCTQRESCEEDLRMGETCSEIEENLCGTSYSKRDWMFLVSCGLQWKWDDRRFHWICNYSSSDRWVVSDCTSVCTTILIVDIQGYCNYNWLRVYACRNNASGESESNAGEAR